MNKQKTFSKYRLWCTKPSATSITPTADLHDDNKYAINHAVLEQVNVPISLDVTKHQCDLQQSEQHHIVNKQTSIPATTLDVTKHQFNLNQLDNVEQSQINYLSLFGLVTKETGQVLQKKSQERKKRSCSSPHFLSLILQAEKQDLDGNDPPEAKQRKRKNVEVLKKKEKTVMSPVNPDVENALKVITTVPPFEEENGVNDYHEEICHVCDNVGELLLCDTCPYVYHLLCAQLSEIPDGKWFCKICQDRLPSNFEIPSVTKDTIPLQCRDLQEKIHAYLKETFVLRSERLNLLKTVKELTTVLENKDDLERSYIGKISEADQLKNNIDKFLSEF